MMSWGGNKIQFIKYISHLLILLINSVSFGAIYRYKIQPRKADAEQALANNDFNPFTSRDNEHPTT